MEKQHMASIIMPTYNGQGIKEEGFNFSVEEQKTRTRIIANSCT